MAVKRIPFYFILTVLIILMTSPVARGQKIWSKGEGEVNMISITQEEAEKKAAEIAINDAITKVTGVNIMNSIYILNSSDDPATKAEEFTKATYRARVIDERNKEMSLIPITVDGRQAVKVRITLEVRLDTEVKKDPSFIVTAELPKPNFRNGEELTATIQTSKDAYITVLNFTDSEGILALVPNKYFSNFFIKGNTKCEFPSKKMKAIGLVFEVQLPDGKDNVIEAIVIIATKKEYPLLGLFSEDPENPLQLVGDRKKLVDWKNKIPTDEIAEIFIHFGIYR